MIINLRICASHCPEMTRRAMRSQNIRFCAFFSLSNIHKNSFRCKEKKEKRFFFFQTYCSLFQENIFELGQKCSKLRFSVKKVLILYVWHEKTTRNTVPPALPVTSLPLRNSCPLRIVTVHRGQMLNLDPLLLFRGLKVTYLKQSFI